MQKQLWNDQWTLLKPGAGPMMALFMGGAEGDPVAIPHDAMIYEKRSQSTKNGHQTGFYPGGCYTYVKRFFAPEDWRDKTVLLEFEGVYQNARVSVNGDYAGGHPFGYGEFALCADDFLKYGQENTVTVVANNSAEENSRWYSGSGIYRDVNLLVGDKVHIARNGLRLSTPDVEPSLAVVQIDLDLVNISRERITAEVVIELTGPRDRAGYTRLPVTVFGGGEEHVRTRAEVESPSLWSCERPDLYTCTVTVQADGRVYDQVSESFGIRSLSLSASRGLRLNGQEVNLRGACIHHDHGVIGAAAFPWAEERRVKKLKEAGFNAVRMSHHPAGRALLNACDRLGMLVMDELSDCWTRPKNNNDYGEKFPYFWREDVAAMVAKDFNHPSVILYSTGNEIQEAGTPKGAQMNREITNEFHRLDNTRYVTVGANGLMAAGARMGEIIQDITRQAPEPLAEKDRPGSGAGADGINAVIDFFQGPMADAFAASPILTQVLDEFASATDVTGYNYLTGRHVLEHALNPNRVILGTETFPSDIVRLWSIVKNHHHVIGDMTWTGWDYIGEAGCGVTYYDGRRGFQSNWPVSLSGMGDLDLLGNRRPISYIREIVFGLRKTPLVTVEPVDRHGRTPSQTTWPWRDERVSWTWHGYEGKPAVIHVYADAPEVELFLNGQSLGRRAAGEENGFDASFETAYQPGELRAVCYREGQAAEEAVLATAEERVRLHIDADRTRLAANGRELSYMMISLRDESGRLNPQAVDEVTVTVEGAGVLQGMGNGDVETLNHYTHNTWQTFEGYVLAVVRAGTTPGEMLVTVSGSAGTEQIKLAVE